MEFEKIVPIINIDNEYMQAWNRWNSIQRFKNSYRELINQEIEPVSENNLIEKKL